MEALQRFNAILEKVGSWGTILFMAVIAIVITVVAVMIVHGAFDHIDEFGVRFLVGRRDQPPRR